ncbi:MAG: hypothetical protein DWQ07_07975 [Chloroflexi bacterium]|nr:MAG: hypothetical protein DWQ07_07975 [Chloroflexota bacterium]MBL1197024.1 hypothetical protein [Chloroflexota bacterium]NOH14318.1 hypothetical protein [Chloroflexota bacterium]
MLGTNVINIWVIPREHPRALQQGQNIDWGDYLVGGDYLSIASKGPNICVILNGDQELLNIRVDANPNLEHLITLCCSEESVTLLFDTFEYGKCEFPKFDEGYIDVYSEALAEL